MSEAWAIIDQYGDLVAVHLGERSGGHFSDEFFKRRGLRVQPVRILAPGELDAETIERCAQAIECDCVDVCGESPDYADVCANELAARIRALTGGGK